MMPGAITFRDRVAVGSVRLVNLLSRRLGRGAGTVAGGRVGLHVSPKLLAHLARSRTVVLVSGTNGKTTTAAMVSAGWGGEVALNQTGSNMTEGHLAAMVESSSPHVVLEVDEKWLENVVAATQPRAVILLNLSRDQLDRSNEVRAIAEQWRQMWATSDGTDERTVVIANVNDPLVVYAAECAPHVRWCDVETTWLADAASCPKCTRALHFSPLGWTCECGFTRPTATTTQRGEHLVINGNASTLRLALPGTFNAANAAMALTALDALEVPIDQAQVRVSRLANVAGRFSQRHWRGHELRLTLAKNPAGFSAMLNTVQEFPGELWIAINARVADGRDPSWLYDVPFESLRGRRVYCFGDRRLDLATRLDLAGVEFELSSEDSPPPPTGPVTVLANYTAFQDWLERSSK
ncbi:MAG TPA: MurT ligase domain-containing protein [Acidimicrobiales bacterium]|nr:MurT ligase domain-containing protein [Acidimicrobiales bacterium]